MTEQPSPSGAGPNAAPPFRRAETLADAERAMGRIAALKSQAEEIKLTATMRRGEIAEWERSELAAIERLVAEESAYLEPFVRERVPDPARKRKSITFPAGRRAGLRDQPSSVVVDDEAAAVDVLWTLRREFVRQSHSLLVAKLKAAAAAQQDGVPMRGVRVRDGAFQVKAQDGEWVPIPGVRIVTPDPKFYIDA